MDMCADCAVGASDQLALGDKVSLVNDQPGGSADMLLKRNITGMGYRKIDEFQAFCAGFRFGRMYAPAKA